MKMSAIAMTMALAICVATTGCAARQEIVLRDDSAITKDVQDRLAADTAGSGGAKIGVETKAGIVSLKGDVSSENMRSSAERIARETPGVRSVDNRVQFGSN
jgi:hyperosmotically inducible protein